MSATQNVIKFGKSNVKVWDVTLTVAAGATSATATSAGYFAGTIRKVEIDPGDMATSATLKIYEANTPLATETRDHCFTYTFPASQVELVAYPMVAALDNDGSSLTTATSVPFVVCDKLTVDLASATAADSVRVRVYIQE
jgi:hypothetical protein